MKEDKEVKKGQVRLKVNEYFNIDSSCGGFVTETGIIYAGMPSKDAFSIIQDRTLMMFASYNHNLYFPVTKKEFKIAETKFNVLDVNPDEILLEYVK